MYILWIHNKQIKTLQPHIKKLLKTSLKRRHNEAALPQIGTCSILARVCKGITSKYTSEQQGLQHLKRINISSSGFFKKTWSRASRCRPMYWFVQMLWKCWVFQQFVVILHQFCTIWSCCFFTCYIYCHCFPNLSPSIQCQIQIFFSWFYYPLLLALQTLVLLQVGTIPTTCR